MASRRGPEQRQREWRVDDDTVTRQRIKPGTIRRILPYARRYRWPITLLILSTVVVSALTAAGPLLLAAIIDDGILARRAGVLLWLCGAVVAAAAIEAAALYAQAWASGRVGEGVVYDLRNAVFAHVQRQPLAFFTRAQTGSLVSRLNTDVIGARDALTAILTQAVATVLTLVFVLVAMFYLSWQISVIALLIIPLFLLPTRRVISRLQRLTRERMQLDAAVGSMMNERFNVSGALLAKLYGTVEDESGRFAARAGRVRDVSSLAGVQGSVPSIAVALLTSLTTLLVYGLGGVLTISGTLQLGTLVAMVSLLSRLYDPVDQLSALPPIAMTALVGFDRVFEVLDLEPKVTDRPSARDLPTAADADGVHAPGIVFDQIRFRYPSASEISLASLESVATPGAELPDDGWVLDGISFHAPAGRLTALVGPSGAGKTTITQLVPRLYDPVEGSVRIDGHDLRDVTLRSLRDTIGVVSQDAHLFHDTLRANLSYACQDADERDIVAACRAALVWDVIQSLPEGLDTVVGDRGHRLSGGEKQRIALARLLLKAPPVVVLDEATAHLDSESEAKIQIALRTALAGRTSLVIAHRLSTVREADQILVVDAGRVRERGTHDELLAADGAYAHLYRTQFAGRSAKSA
jgi:ATP-binding cassette, subfamily B, bacterial